MAIQQSGDVTVSNLTVIEETQQTIANERSDKEQALKAARIEKRRATGSGFAYHNLPTLQVNTGGAYNNSSDDSSSASEENSEDETNYNKVHTKERNELPGDTGSIQANELGLCSRHRE